jgi:hypothetical protein
MDNCAKVSCERPIETIINRLLELKEISIEINRLADGLNYKLYNPEPCNVACGGNGSTENVENLIEEIRSLSRDTRNTLNIINNRL